MPCSLRFGVGAGPAAEDGAAVCTEQPKACVAAVGEAAPVRGSNVVWKFVAPAGQQNHFICAGVALGAFDPHRGGTLYRKLLRGCRRGP